MARHSAAFRDACENPGVDTPEHTREHTPDRPEHTDLHVQHAKKSRAGESTFCTALASSGNPCRARRQAAADVCIYHDPHFARQRRANARLGGIASGEARRKPHALLDARVASLSDPLSVQVLLDAMVRLELLGKMTDARGKRLARLLSLAVRNVGRDGHDPAAYTVHRRVLDGELAGFVRNYEREDHVREAESIASVGQRRRAFLGAGRPPAG